MVECPHIEKEARERTQRREDQTEGQRREDQTEGQRREDKPCVDNSPRLSECPSNRVIWNEDNVHAFWVPGLDVEDALKLVAITHECNQFEVK